MHFPPFLLTISDFEACCLVSVAGFLTALLPVGAVKVPIVPGLVVAVASHPVVAVDPQGLKKEQFWCTENQRLGCLFDLPGRAIARRARTRRILELSISWFQSPLRRNVVKCDSSFLPWP